MARKPKVSFPADGVYFPGCENEGAGARLIRASISLNDNIAIKDTTSDNGDIQTAPCICLWTLDPSRDATALR